LAGADVMEVHFFAPRRVSGVERGVAVIAARQLEPPDAESGTEADAAADAGVEALGELAAAAATGDTVPEETESAPAELESVSLESLDDSPYAADPAQEPAAPDRYTVFTATYRHTLKGPDRGKWEVSVKAEADAPLVTVDQVVRGVQRRAEDTDDVERLTGEEIRAVVDAHQPAVG